MKLNQNPSINKGARVMKIFFSKTKIPLGHRTLKHKLVLDIFIFSINEGAVLIFIFSINEGAVLVLQWGGGGSGGAMALGKLPVPGRPTIWMIVGHGPTALAVGAGGGCLDSHLSFLFSVSLPLGDGSI